MGEEPDLEAADVGAMYEPEMAVIENARTDQTSESAGFTGTAHSVTFEEVEKAAERTHKTIQSSQLGHSYGQAPLSVVSRRYDLDGKGYLDENEKVMRQYDKNNVGALDLREVYKIVEEVRKQQAELKKEREKNLNLKKVIIGLVGFTLILTLAMLGVSFAAATLAKDTRVNTATGSLETKSTGKGVSTIGAANGATVIASPPAEGRQLHGQQKASPPLASFSPNSQKFKQRLLQHIRADHRRRRRELFTSHGRLPYNTDGSASDGNDELSSFAFDGQTLDEMCNSEIDFELDENSFERIRDSYFKNLETSIVLQLKDAESEGNSEWFYQYTMNIDEGYLINDDSVQGIDGHDPPGQQAMILFTQTRLSCNDIENTNDYDECVYYQPFFIFESCVDDDSDGKYGCRVRTCNYGGAAQRLESVEDAAFDSHDRDL